jgi:hypothetical protein
MLSTCYGLLFDCLVSEILCGQVESYWSWWQTHSLTVGLLENWHLKRKEEEMAEVSGCPHVFSL